MTGCYSKSKADCFSEQRNRESWIMPAYVQTPPRRIESGLSVQLTGFLLFFCLSLRQPRQHPQVMRKHCPPYTQLP